MGKFSALVMSKKNLDQTEKSADNNGLTDQVWVASGADEVGRAAADVAVGVADTLRNFSDCEQ